MDISKAKWQKASDVNREYALFELVLEDRILFDMGFSDAGVLEIAFHQNIANKILEWDSFLAALDIGKKLAESDK